MKVYISGPVTGRKQYMERFDLAEEYMKLQGYTVVNPVKVNSALPEDTTHDEYMMTSLAMLEMCDCIFMLRGWQQSKGCNMEFEYACKKGIVILFEGGRGLGKEIKAVESPGVHSESKKRD